jgi:hypothetical protein
MSNNDTLEKPVAQETRQRTLNIREVTNGFVVRLDVTNPEAEMSTGRYVSQEMVVMNLSQLIRKVKTFFEPLT